MVECICDKITRSICFGEKPRAFRLRETLAFALGIGYTQTFESTEGPLAGGRPPAFSSIGYSGGGPTRFMRA